MKIKRLVPVNVCVNNKKDKLQYMQIMHVKKSHSV